MIFAHMREFAKNKIANFEPKISLLLNILHDTWNYNNLKNVDNVYIPLKYFTNKKYESTLKSISKKFNIFIYMPTIVQGNYKIYS